MEVSLQKVESSFTLDSLFKWDIAQPRPSSTRQKSFAPRSPSKKLQQNKAGAHWIVVPFDSPSKAVFERE